MLLTIYVVSADALVTAEAIEQKIYNKGNSAIFTWRK
jgi:hypothetical protein